jgi:hypothetical protein
MITTETKTFRVVTQGQGDKANGNHTHSNADESSFFYS